jgi:hypothetical protein
MLMGMAFGVVLVGLTVLVHYEALRLISGFLLPRLTMMRPRPRIVFVMFGVFAAHTVEVYIYALGFWLMELSGAGVGGAILAHNDGRPILDFVSLLYFSSVAYTSLGFGDIVPLGGAQLVAGIEALNGLLMIGWSASYTYLCMEKLWPLHGGRHRSD